MEARVSRARQAAQFPEGKRRATGRKPGRKAGHQGAQREVPKEIDRTVDYPPPDRCECGGPVEPMGEERSILVEDIPPVRVEVVKHVAHVGRCKWCGLQVSEPLPGDTRQGKSIARTQVGPNATAMTVSLRFDHHVSLAGIAAFLGVWFGLRITAGGVSHLLVRQAERAQPAIDEIQSRIRTAPVVGLDETGLHQNGIGGWAWLARTQTASLFRRAPVQEVRRRRTSRIVSQDLRRASLGTCRDTLCVPGVGARGWQTHRLDAVDAKLAELVAEDSVERMQSLRSREVKGGTAGTRTRPTSEGDRHPSGAEPWEIG